MADIFVAVNPLLHASKFFGLGPFYIDGKRKTLNVFALGLIYSALMLIAFTTNAAFLTYTKVIYKDKSINSYIGLASDVILLTCGIVVTVSCILFTIVQRNKFIRVVQDFHGASFEVAKLNEEIPYREARKNCFRHLFFLFLTLSVLFIHTILYIQNLTTLLYVSYMYAWFVPKVYNFLMEYQFVAGVHLLKIHFNIINKCLKKFENGGVCIMEGNKVLGVNGSAWVEAPLSRMRGRYVGQAFSILDETFPKFRSRKIWSTANSSLKEMTDLEKIKIIRKIHGNLCDIKGCLNNCFSLQLLASVAQAFIVITVNLYMIFTTLSTVQKSSFLTASYPVLWAVTHTAELIIIVVSCTNASKAANYTAVLVHKLLAKESKPELKNQLKLFSIQLLHRKIFFTAAGFFNLDMTLLQAIIGAATTYLVILIQFHNTYDVPKDA